MLATKTKELICNLPSSSDIDKLETIKTLESEDSDPLEKVKEKPPPGVNASLVLFYIIFLTMFLTGCINFSNCSTNEVIPIYLIVTGLIGALAKLLNKLRKKWAFRCVLVLVILYIIWNGIGTYVVYKEYQPNYMPVKNGTYCNRTTYLLAFWTLTIQYTLLGIFVLLSMCYLFMKGSFDNKDVT